MSDADRARIEQAVSMALEEIGVDSETKQATLDGVGAKLRQSGPEHIARNVQALDLEDLPLGEVSEVGAMAGGTHGPLGTSANTHGPLGTPANAGGPLGTPGAIGTGPLGTPVPGTSRRPGITPSAFLGISCDSYGRLEPFDEPDVPASDGGGAGPVRMGCLTAGSRPLIAWPQLEGMGPFEVIAVGIDLQTAMSLQQSSSAAVASSVWYTRVSGRSVVYGGPPLSTAGGAGIFVALVVPVDGEPATFVAIVL